MTARLLWASLVMSTVFLLITLQILQGQAQRAAPLPAPTSFAIALLGCVTFMLSFVAPRALRRRLIVQARHATREVPRDGPDAGGYRDGVAVTRVFVDPEGTERLAWGAYQTTLILGLALAESCALFGFVIAFLNQSMLLSVPLFALAWIAMSTKFPTRRAFVDPLERVTGATLPQ